MTATSAILGITGIVLAVPALSALMCMIALKLNGYNFTRSTMRDVYDISFLGWPIMLGMIVLIPMKIYDGIVHLFIKTKIIKGHGQS